MGTDLERVGNVPKRRLLLSAGEWIFEGVRLAVEYALVVDYSRGRNGTSKSASGVFGVLTFEW